MRTSLKRLGIIIPVTALLLTMATGWAQENGDIKARSTFEMTRKNMAKFICVGPLVGKRIKRVKLQEYVRKGVSLCGTELSDVDLRNAKLNSVDLRYANLSYADLSSANLTGADLSSANLTGAKLSNANFSGVDLYSANLSEAFLDNTNLNGVNLSNANLSGAGLSGTNLTGVNLSNANLSGVLFSPKNLPKIDTIASANKIELMYDFNQPMALVKLRKAFDDAGYHNQARRITYAIKRGEYRSNPAAHQNSSLFEILKLELGWESDTIEKNASLVENIEMNLNRNSIAAEWISARIVARHLDIWKLIGDSFRYIFFDLPTQWGIKPGRAIRAILLFIGIFSLPYIIALRFPGSGRIYRKWGPENHPSPKPNAWRSKTNITAKTNGDIEALRYGWGKAISSGLQFSIISAFYIGWRDLNVGNWISRLQARDYTLYGVGWVRSFAGIQALLSVYLLAMWVLTYFGRPFG